MSDNVEGTEELGLVPYLSLFARDNYLWVTPGPEGSGRIRFMPGVLSLTNLECTGVFHLYRN
jgi:hypothetical protein